MSTWATAGILVIAGIAVIRLLLAINSALIIYSARSREDIGARNAEARWEELKTLLIRLAERK
ncbi:MAG TPA: hypothetical protein VKA08_14255 [Balneolales bacterium]|nr:hypothetical protein [Balneolales bacterium]